MKLSVIICAYNRCKSLKLALESICRQFNNEAFDCELIIVDNNSTDHTRETVESFIDKHKNVRYVFEKQQGLSYARNRGIREARGEIIAFTDDDVIVEKTWITNICRFFDTYKADAMGGKVIPLYPAKTPSWIKAHGDIISGPILAHDYGDDVKIYERPQMFPFVGANMAYKKEVFYSNGLFRTDLGPGNGTMGDDTDLFNRLLKANKKIYYCGKASVWHPVERNRMSLFYIAKWEIAFGKYTVLRDGADRDKDSIYYFGVPRYLLRKVIGDFFVLISKLFNTRDFLKQWTIFFRNIGIMQQYRKSLLC